MPLRRQRRLYAPTHSTSLTLNFTTSKVLSQSYLSHLRRWQSKHLPIFSVYLSFPLVFSGAVVFAAVIDSILQPSGQPYPNFCRSIDTI